MSKTNELLPMVCLARHDETSWTFSRQHTGLTDLPLTQRGERKRRNGAGSRFRLAYFLDEAGEQPHFDVLAGFVQDFFKGGIGNETRPRFFDSHTAR